MLDIFSPAALSPAPVLSLKPVSQLEPATKPASQLQPAPEVPAPSQVLSPEPEPAAVTVPVLASSPVVDPAPEPPPDLEPSLAPAPELDPVLPHTFELEPAPVLEPSWLLPGATENGLPEKPHLLLFPPDLVAEQFTLMDAVSGPVGRGKAGLPLDFAVKTCFLVQPMSQGKFWLHC